MLPTYGPAFNLAGRRSPRTSRAQTVRFIREKPANGTIVMRRANDGDSIAQQRFRPARSRSWFLAHPSPPEKPIQQAGVDAKPVISMLSEAGLQSRVSDPGGWKVAR